MMNQEPETIVLRPSRLKWVASVLMFIPILILFTWLSMFDLRGLWGILLVLIVIGAGIVRLSSSGQLRINEIGFTADLLHQHMSYRWDEVSEFSFIDHWGGQHPQREVKFADLNDAQSLPDLYGLSPKKLATLLNTYRSRYYQKHGLNDDGFPAMKFR